MRGRCSLPTPTSRRAGNEVGAARKFRRMVVDEDAGDSCEVWATAPDDELEDALDHAVAAEDLWPRWWCDGCDTRNEGARWTCAYCGTVRHDADVCA